MGQALFNFILQNLFEAFGKNDRNAVLLFTFFLQHQILKLLSILVEFALSFTLKFFPFASETRQSF
jgi:hypothetical protein